MTSVKDFVKYARAYITRDLSEDVIFRIFTSRPHNVLALWPAVAAGHQGRWCSCYEHVGQHGEADYDVVMRKTRPAVNGEHHALLAELRQRGYSPNVIRRATAAHRKARMA